MAAARSDGQFQPESADKVRCFENWVTLPRRVGVSLVQFQTAWAQVNVTGKSLRRAGGGGLSGRFGLRPWEWAALDTCQPPSRIGDQLQIDKRGLDRPMTQPPAQVVVGDAVHDQVPGVAMPERVGSDVSPLGQTAQLHRPPNRFLDTPPGRGPVDEWDHGRPQRTGGPNSGRFATQGGPELSGSADLCPSSPGWLAGRSPGTGRRLPGLPPQTPAGQLSTGVALEAYPGRGGGSQNRLDLVGLQVFRQAATFFPKVLLHRSLFRMDSSGTPL